MLAEKLRIKPGMTLTVLNAPDNYEQQLGPLPEGVTIRYKPGRKNEFIQLFVTNKAELEKEIFKACATLPEAGLIWITYPKGSSRRQTDLTRDKGWECLEQLDMEWLALISFDDCWSAFLMRNTPAKKKPNKASVDYHSNTSAYADPATKTVIVPEDLALAFQSNAAAKDRFEAYAYSHRKEYVLWIVSAKKEETRQKRILQTIEMLLAGKKNPADKGS